MSSSGMPSETEQNCPYIKKKYWKPGICQLVMSEVGEEGDDSVNACSINDKICQLEFGFECDTYKEWLEKTSSANP